MYAQEMKLPEGKKCAAFISVNLAAEFFWLSLDKKAAEMPKTLSLGQYGMTHGLPRLLGLLDELHLKATFFVPGKPPRPIRTRSRKSLTEVTRSRATAMNMRILVFWTQRSSASASERP